MDKAELKQTLHNQFVPLAQAVEAKLQCLQDNDVFLSDAYAEDIDNYSDDDSLENAFNSTLSASSVPMYQAPKMEEIKNMQQTPQPSYIDEAPNADSINTHKQSIAAKIAALRGISMPGDYLRDNK